VISLGIAADLRIEGHGLNARLVGPVGDLKLIVKDVAITGVRRGQARSLAGALNATGTRLTVVDEAGRSLATAGAGVGSRVGSAVFGTAQIRPHLRSLPWALGQRRRKRQGG
jgi:hypothetical protein